MADAVPMSLATVKSLTKEQLVAMPAAEREAALAQLPLFSRLLSRSIGGHFSFSDFWKVVHDFIVSTVDTPDERKHIEAEVDLAEDKFMAPMFGGVDSKLYVEVKTLTNDLLDRLLTKIGGDTPPLT